MKVEIIPLLEDNYAYFIIDEGTFDCLVVDPAEAEKVMLAFHKVQSKYSKKLNFHTILTTHKHWDHAGGNNAMLALMKNQNQINPNEKNTETLIRCYGGKLDNVEGCTNSVEHGDQFEIGNLKIECIHTPGHTNGHICYFVQDINEEENSMMNVSITSTYTDSNSNTNTNTNTDNNIKVTRGLFCGDCLFAGGSGRFSEGTPSDMYLSFERLRVLPSDTNIYCGHEYTLANYRFATWLDETNILLQEQNQFAKSQRENNQPTIPTTLKTELDTNPFFRTSELRERVYNMMEEKDKILLGKEEREERDVNIWVMGYIRELKNKF